MGNRLRLPQGHSLRLFTTDPRVQSTLGHPGQVWRQRSEPGPGKAERSLQTCVNQAVRTEFVCSPRTEPASQLCLELREVQPQPSATSGGLSISQAGGDLAERFLHFFLTLAIKTTTFISECQRSICHHSPFRGPECCQKYAGHRGRFSYLRHSFRETVKTDL